MLAADGESVFLSCLGCQRVRKVMVPWANQRLRANTAHGFLLRLERQMLDHLLIAFLVVDQSSSAVFADSRCCWIKKSIERFTQHSSCFGVGSNQPTAPVPIVRYPSRRNPSITFGPLSWIPSASWPAKPAFAMRINLPALGLSHGCLECVSPGVNPIQIAA